MSNSGPPDKGMVSDFAERIESAPTDERVYRVALEITEPTTVSEVASRADCSKNAARRHLKRLADIGLLTTVMEDPATYERNESYFRWRRLNRLAELSEDEYNERLRELLSKHESYKDKYGVERPDELDPLEYGEFGDAERVWLDVNDWRAVRNEIRDLRLARQGDIVDEGVA
jgi:predicted transcriptional regulator